MPGTSRIRILHLSDLHFGAHHYFLPEGPGLGQILAQDPSLGHLDLVAVSGDLTWTSSPDEFAACGKFLIDLHQATNAPLLVVPGNHDVDFLDRFRGGGPPLSYDARQLNFVEMMSFLVNSGVPIEQPHPGSSSRLAPRERLVYTQSGNGWFSVGVNSAALLGRSSDSIEFPVALSGATFEHLDALVRARPSGEIRVFVLHHHLLPFVEPEWGARAESEEELGMHPDTSLLANSGQLQAWLSSNGFAAVLHGHKHVTHGRLDTVWAGDHNDGRQTVIIGAGSAGVDTLHRPNSRPLTYNIVEILQSPSRCEVTTVVHKIERSAGRTRTHHHFSFRTSIPRQQGRQALYTFEGEATDECHALISRALQGGGVIRNFISIVHSPDYTHPDTLQWRGSPAPHSLVERAFRVLEPYVDQKGGLSARHARVEPSRGLRFQIDHGSRLFKSHFGHPSSSPYAAALQALASSEGGRRSYAALYRTELDANPMTESPPPGLVGVQFLLDDVGGRRTLHLVAAFRHLELSFWWGVNSLEMSRILHLATRDAPFEMRPDAGSITMFASLAGWEEDPGLVAQAELDSMESSGLIQLISGALERDRSSRTALGRLLLEKSEYTNTANIEAAGLGACAAAIRGLVHRINSTDERDRWLQTGEKLLEAVRHLAQAVLDSPGERGRHVDAASACILEASLLVERGAD